MLRPFLCVQASGRFDFSFLFFCIFAVLTTHDPWTWDEGVVNGTWMDGSIEGRPTGRILDRCACDRDGELRHGRLVRGHEGTRIGYGMWSKWLYMVYMDNP